MATPRRLHLFVLPILLLAAGCSATRPAVTVDVPIASGYVYRGAVLSDDPVLQPAIWVEQEAGESNLGLGLWSNFELGDSNDLEGKFNEYDVTLDHSRTFGRFDTSVGASRYEYPNNGYSSSIEVYALVSVNDLPVTPGFEVWYDCVDIDGAYFNFNLSRQWAMGESWTASTVAGLGWMDENQAGANFGVEASGLSDALVQGSLAYALTDSVTLTAVLAYSSVLDGEYRDAVEDADNTIVAFGVSCTF